MCVTNLRAGLPRQHDARAAAAQKSLPAVAVPLVVAYLKAMGSTLGADSVTVKTA